MSKVKDVLVIEFQEVFDKVAFRITYQDESILKRGEFRDFELRVYSSEHSNYSIGPGDDNGRLYIRGDVTRFDDNIVLVRKEDVEIIKQKVAAINQKYGIKQRWRAEIGEDYFYIKGGPDCSTCRTHTEEGLTVDDRRYAVGNYFKTLEQAAEVVKRMSWAAMRYHEEIMNRGDE